jgi:hypothetical protein
MRSVPVARFQVLAVADVLVKKAGLFGLRHADVRMRPKVQVKSGRAGLRSSRNEERRLHKDEASRGGVL